MYESHIDGFPVRRGKVRDVYDLGDQLVIIASDRISAFDWVLPTPIPDKGRILTAMSLFWFEYLKVPNHIISTNLSDMPAPFQAQKELLRGRSMLVRKTKVVPIECVARGYLIGSGWKEYQQWGTVCGITLPTGLHQAEKLKEPIFTPATKAETGHDENISFSVMIQDVGKQIAEELRERTLDVYKKASEHAASKGIILADTKLEWGITPEKEIILIDEVLTPDSSRYWPMDQYKPGTSPPSFDKQFVRDWLETTNWDKQSPPPQLPEEVVNRTRQKYVEAYERVTGRTMDF